MNKEYYESGKKTRRELGNTHYCGLAFEETFKRKAECAEIEYISFSSGWENEDRMIRQERRSENRVDEFIKEITDICKKYNASLSTGCGCCGGGGAIGDSDFEIQIQKD